ncbi:hypothetical protein SAMN04490182_5028 [Pseudomonas cedrina]|uniref:Uncharacterized protein n=2 Tax=Pseudomonas cedrina TaxID=651740 RepID=A0A1V2K2P3_PSECE|nr:hypothetical protein [Pseudomonas cedrina]ONH51879.1 hypothetical protein BLL36_20405 [Pseudomonas cedrina subsp. cedrina]SDT50233.1 hypothetical protein SAMN04490182_5028 [Pseudomonas cedrina]
MSLHNGTYSGRIYDYATSDNVLLTLSWDTSTRVAQGSMSYFNLIFSIIGTFEAPLNFNLQATTISPEVIELTLSLKTLNNTFASLEGTAHVARGGPNVGKTYDMVTSKI